ncbi:cell wall hydrolase [Amphibacillus cookii]|uniref:cell wall hydrolase n=1 Tax=Amphibacillus cookii TaxID=767787 RepID=UPI00195623F5|nr:cell wall hydrolase [Amphibacillus cookii]MBM7542499.1 N-acetylmuramoyl-L-alanine amidase [Amphibacillus cookii]
MKSTLIKCLLLSFVLTITSIHHNQEVYAFSPQVVQHGATGEDVVELQARLQYIGFYNGQIDGVFDWGTYWALRHFQHEFGMKVDGLAGDQVKDMLERATDYDEAFVRENLKAGRTFTHYGGMNKEDQVKHEQPPAQEQQKKEQPPGGEDQSDQEKPDPKPEQQVPDPEPGAEPEQPAPEPEPDAEPEQPAPEPEQEPEPDFQEEPQPEPEAEQPDPEQDGEPIEPTSVNVPNGYSQNDIQLMAQAVYGEARGEPYEGQVAVAAVILNRIQSSTFPNTVSSVIFEPLAFTAVADGQIYMDPDDTARRAVLDAINGWDPSGEAIYYFNPDTATSTWIWSRPHIKRIGKHIFCM